MNKFKFVTMFAALLLIPLGALADDTIAPYWSITNNGDQTVSVHCQGIAFNTDTCSSGQWYTIAPGETAKGDFAFHMLSIEEKTQLEGSEFGIPPGALVDCGYGGKCLDVRLDVYSEDRSHSYGGFQAVYSGAPLLWSSGYPETGWANADVLECNMTPGDNAEFFTMEKHTFPGTVHTASYDPIHAPNGYLENITEGACVATVSDLPPVAPPPPPPPSYEGYLYHESRSCMQVATNPFQNGRNIHLWNDCDSGSPKENREWKFEGSTGYIRNLDDPSYCIVKKDYGWANGNNIHLYKCDDANVEDKTWTFGVNADTTPTLFRAAQNPNKCIDLSGGNTSNGTNIQLWDCTGSTNQLWRNSWN